MRKIEDLRDVLSKFIGGVESHLSWVQYKVPASAQQTLSHLSSSILRLRLSLKSSRGCLEGSIPWSPSNSSWWLGQAAVDLSADGATGMVWVQHGNSVQARQGRSECH